MLESYLTRSCSSDTWYELKPGSPAVCGHGNREFSFFAKKGKNPNKVEIVFSSMTFISLSMKMLLILLAGGLCWDSGTCLGKTPADRKMAIDSLADSYLVTFSGNVQQLRDELAPAVPQALKNMIKSTTGKSTFETGILQQGSNFSDWSVVIVPDCTGDMHIGNRTITYDAGLPSCITAHHAGAVNTGLAIQWMMKYFPSLTDVLVAGTSFKQSKASGGSGGSYWAWYLQERYTTANIRSVTDSDLAIYGPQKKQIFQTDPWGTLNASVPDKSFLGNYVSPTSQLQGKKPNFLAQGFLLPAKNEYFFADDDKTYYIRYITSYYPSVIFADISLFSDLIQEQIFLQTGGRVHDCCYDGCSCTAQQPIGVRGGKYDWQKTQRVTIWRRDILIPNNYRIWLDRANPTRHFLLFWEDFVTHQLVVNDTKSYQTSTANTWLYNLVNSRVIFTTISTGIVVSNNLKPSNASICLGCLNGVLGSGPGEEKCLMSWGPGESSMSVAPMFKTDWLALWSLNGGDSPDLIISQSYYRFGHEYVILPGETLAEIANRFGTTETELTDLNYNLITHISNPYHVMAGDVICIVPHFAAALDRMGNPLCPSNLQTFGAQLPV
eukprot:761851-Hanusia_phi.AAC.2